MRQVFEQYASSVVAVFMASVLFFLIMSGNFLNGNGIAQVLGEILHDSISEHSISESSAFDNVMSGAAPTIVQKDGSLVAKNQRTLLSDCFEARSNQGDVLPVYLKKAWGLDGEEIDIGCSTDRSSICVSEAGVYWLQLYAIDENYKETSVVVKLLVNER